MLKAGPDDDRPGGETFCPPTNGWPMVSVIVPTRDRTDVVRRAVERIFDQGYPGVIQVIVVFDQQMVLPLPALDRPGRELRMLVNHRTPGPAGARNCGVIAARGALVAFCDDDDEWLPDKLRLQVGALLDSQKSSVVSCGIRIRYRGRTFQRIPERDKIDSNQLLQSRRVDAHLSTVLTYKQAFISDIGPFDEETPGGYGEDYDWLLRAAEHAPITCLKAPLVVVTWGGSWFAERWELIISAIQYQLEKHPELMTRRKNLARMYGRLAFAHAATGQRGAAALWSFRTIRLDPGQSRAYLALLVSTGLVSADRVVRALRWIGRGV